MSFDLKSLRRAVAAHGLVSRVVVAEVSGSAPREVGASMLVWEDGQSGTIGGGALELDAATRARAGGDWLDRIALGPGLGQCCGGAVTLLAEIWDKTRLADIDGAVVVRQVSGTSDMPIRIKSLLKQARNSGNSVAPQLMAGWMIEPVSMPSRDIWIYGAGHVGRAIVAVLSPFPEIAITWVDSAADRFPGSLDDSVSQLVAENPAAVVQYAPPGAEHLVLTYSHAMDLEICHQVLRHGFRSAGLIGSKTKWARFRRKLAALGHSESQIARIICPIGQPGLGRSPHAIAVGVAAELLSPAGMLEISNQRTG